MAQSLGKWLPDDWPRTTAPIDLGERARPSLSSSGGSLRAQEPSPGPPNPRRTFIQRSTEEKVVKDPPGRKLRRQLRGIQLFMITINGMFGIGLYGRSGNILELGGPLAVLLSFLLIGCLTWAVMQCVTELLCLWPVPGALSVYVRSFVDEELGIAVGVAYWFAYSVSFSCLIAGIASIFKYWTHDMADDRPVIAIVVYVLVPILLALVNTLTIKWYGWFEVVAGIIKIVFLFIVVVILLALRIQYNGTLPGGTNSSSTFPGGTNSSSPDSSDWDHEVTTYDKNAAPHWIAALFMSLSIATFSFVGVEMIAASALEARWPEQEQSNPEAPGTSESQRPRTRPLVGNTVKFSALFVPIIAALAYSISGLLMSLNIGRMACGLPRLNWIKQLDDNCIGDEDLKNQSVSPFVLIARGTGHLKGLHDAFNVFILITAITCASSQLYVASRTLFGLTRHIEGGERNTWILRCLAWFGRTNSHAVPVRAMILSALAFCWVPFLQITEESALKGDATHSSSGGFGESKVGKFLEILAGALTNGVTIVWTCQCLAFVRYYNCVQRHRAVLESRNIALVQRWNCRNGGYSYRSHAQPFLAYVAFGGCMFILIICNSAFMWNGFNLIPFLSSYLIVIVFALLWVALKFHRGAEWKLTDLSTEAKVLELFRQLHEQRAETF